VGAASRPVRAGAGREGGRIVLRGAHLSPRRSVGLGRFGESPRASGRVAACS
jgi:hypothetical protein